MTWKSSTFGFFDSVTLESLALKNVLCTSGLQHLQAHFYAKLYKDNYIRETELRKDGVRMLCSMPTVT